MGVSLSHPLRRRNDGVGQSRWACEQTEKKGRNASVPTLFRYLAGGFDVAPLPGNAPAFDARSASALTHRLGFLDGGFVIPAAAARRVADIGRSLVGGGFDLILATAADGRTATDRELVDLCRPVIQTRIHRFSPCVAAHGPMLRPTRS